MIGHRHHQARFQSDFYRDVYHKSLAALLMAILVMLCLIGAIIYVVFEQPATQYYATTTSGQIIPMTPRA